MLVMGFHTDNFVLHDITTGEQLLSFPCGGGHRAWDLSLCEREARFIHIKAGDVALTSSTVKQENLVLKVT